jgi:hypothetical protein
VPKILLKRGLKGNLPTLEEGEPGYTTDTKEVFIGTSELNVQLAKQADVNSLSEGLSQTNTRFDDLQLVDANTELLYARGGDVILGDRLDRMEDISINIEKFPLQIPEIDDSARFTRALNALGPNGGTIILPQGKTYTGTFLINKSNIRLTGGGILKGVIQLYGTDTTGVSRFGSTGTGDIYIEGITIDGEKSRDGITCKWVYGVTITNVTFTHCLKSINFEPIPKAQHCSRFTISNNRLWDCNYGLYVDYDTSITDSVIYEVGDITYVNNTHESRNSGWDGTFGNQYHIWAKGIDGLVCKGNTFFFSTTGQETTNIYVELFNWVLIEGNQIFQPPLHGVHAVNGQNLIVANNNIAFPLKQGIYLSNITTGAVRGNNITYNDDSVNLTGRTGIYLEASPFFIGNISDNNIYFPNEYAIYIKDSSLITIRGNNARNKYATAEPIKIDTLGTCNDILINGNLFTNFPTSLQSVIASKGSQQRIYYQGNGEGGSSAVFEGVFLSKRTATINASQTALDSTSYDQFNFNNATTHMITGVTGGIEGKEILFVGFNGNTTISATIGRLKGGTDATIPNYGTMKLKFTAGNWYEIARNF